MEITLRCKAFSNRPVQAYQIDVNEDGTIIVFDDLSQRWVARHNMSAPSKRLAKMLALQRQGLEALNTDQPPEQMTRKYIWNLFAKIKNDAIMRKESWEALAELRDAALERLPRPETWAVCKKCNGDGTCFVLRPGEEVPNMDTPTSACSTCGGEGRVRE